MTTGTLFVISAPSGTGKTSLVRKLSNIDEKVQVSISHTTRTPRPQEQTGVDYHFVNEATFTKMREENHFLECAEVFGNWYGTSQERVNSELKSGKDVVLEIDWQGAQQIARLMPCVRVFILPPSRAALQERLHQRATDDLDTMQRRLAAATDEMSHYGEFDYIVVNERFERAVEELQAIVLSQRLQISKQSADLAPLLKDLLSL